MSITVLTHSVLFGEFPEEEASWKGVGSRKRSVSKDTVYEIIIYFLLPRL